MELTLNDVNRIKNSSETIKKLSNPEDLNSIYYICSKIEDILNNIDVWSSEVLIGSQIKDEITSIKEKLLSVADNTKTLNEHIELFTQYESERLRIKEGVIDE